MNAQLRRSAILFLLLPLLGACNRQSPSPSPSPQAAAATAKEAAAQGVVPGSLMTVEEKGEDVIDQVSAGAWDGVADDLATIADAWKTYRDRVTADAAPLEPQKALSDALTRLQAAAAEKDRTAVLRSVDDMIAAAIDLFDVYNPAVPTDLGRLDVAERRVALDASLGDLDAAGSGVDQVAEIWGRLRPSVTDHGGQGVATDFDASLAGQREALAAKGADKLQTEAKNAQELVDRMEKLY